MQSLRLYFKYIGVSIRSQMQYRASFIMLTIQTFILTGIEFLGIWVLFARFGHIRGWTLPQIALLAGMANIAFSIAEATVRGFDTFPSMVKAGDFDRLLLRPRSTVLQLLGQELQLIRIGRFLQGLTILLWAAFSLHISWSIMKVGLMVAAILGGACIFSGLFILQATLSFWTVETLEIMNTVTYGGVEAAQFPLTIYRPWFQKLFIFVVPLACLNYFPGMAILGKTDVLGSTRLLSWVSPLIGLAFLAITLRIWEIGVRRYRSTGS